MCESAYERGRRCLERLQRVFRDAAWQAVRELEHYYATQAYKETGRAVHMGDGHGTVRRV